MSRTSIQFSKSDLAEVDHAVRAAEDLVNNFFKMSSGQWLKNRYDIKTAKDLAPHEYVAGPVAQVIKYEARQNYNSLGSSGFTLYKVCLQDNAILDTLEVNLSLKLAPFLLYILTHELVHVVRFSKYEQRYETRNEADVPWEEEQTVHRLTHEILGSVTVSGLKEVFEFYGDWLTVRRGESGSKNYE